MRKTLTILTAVVLLGLSFNLSSCKQCGKKENEPTGRNDVANKTASDTETAVPDNPTQTLEELKTDIIRLVNVAGKFLADDDTLFRDIIEDAASNIERSIDDDNSYVKKWADEFFGGVHGCSGFMR